MPEFTMTRREFREEFFKTEVGQWIDSQPGVSFVGTSSLYFRGQDSLSPGPSIDWRTVGDDRKILDLIRGAINGAFGISIIFSEEE